MKLRINFTLIENSGWSKNICFINLIILKNFKILVKTFIFIKFQFFHQIKVNFVSITN